MIGHIDLNTFRLVRHGLEYEEKIHTEAARKLEIKKDTLQRAVTETRAIREDLAGLRESHPGVAAIMEAQRAGGFSAGVAVAKKQNQSPELTEPLGSQLGEKK